MSLLVFLSLIYRTTCIRLSLRDDRRQHRPAAITGVCAPAARLRNSDVVVYQLELTASYTLGNITRIINYSPFLLLRKGTRS